MQSSVAPSFAGRHQFRFESRDEPRRDLPKPLGFEHDLDRDPLFADSSLQRLTERYADRDFFIADSAPSADTEFYAVPSCKLRPSEAIENLTSRRLRILLKRPETYDSRFRDLLHETFATLVEKMGGSNDDRVVRLESGIFLSSAVSITPFHFDPEITFFLRSGAKRRITSTPRRR